MVDLWEETRNKRKIIEGKYRGEEDTVKERNGKRSDH